MNQARRLTWRFALLPALAMAVLTSVMLAVEHQLLDADLSQRSLVRMQQRADVLGLQLQAALRDAVNQVRLQARSPLVQPNVPPARVRAELDKLIAESPKFVWIGLIAPDGRVLAGSKGWLEGQSIAARPVFRQGLRGMVGDIHEAVALAPLLGHPAELIDIGEPVLDDDGKVVAVITAHLGLHWVGNVLTASLGEPQVAREAGLTGLVITSPSQRSVLKGVPVPDDLPASIPSARAWQAADGTTHFIAQSPLRGEAGEAALLDWRVVVMQRQDAALAIVDRLSNSMIRVGVLAALLLAAAGVWMSRRMLKPWGPVFEAVLAHERLGDHAGVANRVQTLVAQRADPSPVARLMGWLARDAGNLRRAIDHLPLGIALVDRDYRVEYLNPAFTRLLGWTTEGIRGNVAGECLFGAAERDALLRLYQQLDDPPGEFAARLDALTASGERVAVQWHLVPMLNAQGERVGALSIVHDIRAERSARVRADALADRLRALAEAAVDTLLATLDIDGRVLEWNRGAAQLSGTPAAAALGRRLDEVLPCGHCAADSLREAQIHGIADVSVEMDLPERGRRRFAGTIYALGLAPGSARFGVILRDVTEEYAARQALADGAARLSAVIGNASDAIVSVNAQGRITLFNPSAERIFGYPAAQMLGAPLDVLLPPVAQPSHGPALDAFAHSGVSQRAMGAGRVNGVHADGRLLTLEASISQAVTNGQTVLTAILRDVTDRVNQQALLERTRDELAQLNRRLLEQEKQTSRKLAQSLHDELGQTLAALRLHWEAYGNAAEAQKTRMNERIAHLVVLANRQVRSVLSELRPPLLDELGLAAALDNEIRQHAPAEGDARVRLEASSAAQLQRWLPDVEYAVFMVAREALLNALRHASAREITLYLEGDEHRLTLAVCDDGIGIAPDARISRPGHLGLVGMRERAHAIGAELHIGDATGRGTMVTLTWEAADEPHLPG
ncbi:MAG: PAS domain S-box protein [Burkholderiales bacterium]|nr:MAG: PAS domain S-box protein [Burkholderiales bacterium]